jgi:hypothetical protein
MSTKMKLSGMRFVDFFGVLMPALAIYGFLAFLGMFVPVCARDYWLMDGNKPLPNITEFVVETVKGSPVPFHWIGLAIMLVLLAVAYLIARGAPSGEAALRRLFLLVSVEWCCIGFVMFVSLAGLDVGMNPADVSIRDNTDLSIMPQIVDSFVKSQSVVVYEGLPSQYAEPALFYSQRNSKPTARIEEFYFYQSPLNFAAGDKEELQRMMTNARPFVSATYNNKEFHPEFALEWQDASGRKDDALICLGSSEVKFYGPDVYLHCDIARPAYRSIREMLIYGYRKNLPDAAIQ